ncbi:MAG TPA: 2Fe-2S iron-sulfur cluster-binding protein [Actinomycetota bacterium]|nr:2Fe-2S iron-sulfur cluster-binding protein [Actinomycetota bacterium]
MSEAGSTRRFRVFRFKRGDMDWHFDTFEVPVGPSSTVLDALRWIQRKLDRSLMIRHSCLHASCGTCGMQIDGREALACVTAVADLGGTVTVEPLANIPVLSDLVVDMEEFYARFPDEIGSTRASEGPAGAEVPEGIDAYERFEDCIECGLCLSACPVSATSDEYVGPAALAAAQRLLEEPRGVDPAGVLDWAAAPNGAWRCHAAFECTEACPSDVNPAARIMQLRSVLVRGGAKDGAA